MREWPTQAAQPARHRSLPIDAGNPGHRCTAWVDRACTPTVA